MLAQEEIGIILSRLALEDASVAPYLLGAAQAAQERMLPGDVEKIADWLSFIEILRQVVQRSASQREDFND